MLQLVKNAARRAGLERKHVAQARMFCERHALATTRRSGKDRGGRILCYHAVGQPEFGVNDVPPALFARQLELALRAGYTFVPASRIARTGGSPRELAVTFDDGLKSIITQARPILRDLGIPYTVFVVSEWCEHIYPWQTTDVLSWREVEQIMGEGAEIGSHSKTHRDFADLNRPRMVVELFESRLAIEQKLGFKAEEFAIPLGQSRNWSPLAAEIAREAGYEIVYAQAEETRPCDTVPRTFVTKFDSDRIFKALLRGAYDRWEEWV
jgi:peptidoglycan/xylan/chitin deacetylase (PgdA/CDA1 family)